MGSLFQRHALAAFLGLVAAILLVVIGIETGWGNRVRVPVPAESAARPAPVEAKLLPPFPLESPDAAYPETANRPLFIATRRQAPAAVAQATMNKGQFVLQGVTIVGDLRIALLRERAGNKTHRLEKGREVNGITVAEIDADKVTLRQGGDSEVVSLLVQRPGTLPGPGPAGGAAAAITPSAAGPAAGPFPAPPAAPPAVALPSPGIPNTAAPGAPARLPSPTNIPPRTGGGPIPVPGQPALPGGPSFPTTPQQAAPGANPTGQMTAEEILARRRARRQQQQPE